MVAGAPVAEGDGAPAAVVTAPAPVVATAGADVDTALPPVSSSSPHPAATAANPTRDTTATDHAAPHHADRSFMP